MSKLIPDTIDESIFLKDRDDLEDDLRDLFVENQKLKAINAELLEALEKLVDVSSHIEQIPLHYFSKAGAAIAKAKDQS